MTQSLFQKAQGLIEFLAQDPLRAQVLTFLSREIGPTGEPAAIAFLQLARDGVLHVVAHEGFAHFDPQSITQIDIDSDRASSNALRSGRLQILTLADRREHQSDLPADLKEYWKSSVAIPIGLQSIYFINFREDVTKVRDFKDYISVVSSLLTNFEWHLRVKSGRTRDPWYDSESESLSEREERIVELIREGMTNFQIANQLGYSESLIRQETVSIYRKLGVNGRKELRSAELTPKRAARNAIRVAIALTGIDSFLPLLEAIEKSQTLFF